MIKDGKLMHEDGRVLGTISNPLTYAEAMKLRAGEWVVCLNAEKRDLTPFMRMLTLHRMYEVATDGTFAEAFIMADDNSPFYLNSDTSSRFALVTLLPQYAPKDVSSRAAAFAIAMYDLILARNAFFEGSPHTGDEKSPEGYLYAAIKKVIDTAVPYGDHMSNALHIQALKDEATFREKQIAKAIEILTANRTSK